MNCFDNVGNTHVNVDHERCDGEQPTTWQRCDMGDCRKGVKNWGPCSEQCGEGIRTREMVCVDPQGAVVDMSRCSGPDPILSESCQGTNCKAEYVVSDWSACSTSCGKGKRNRDVPCMRNTVFVHDSACDGDTPANQEDCEVYECNNRADAQKLFDDAQIRVNSMTNALQRLQPSAGFTLVENSLRFDNLWPDPWKGDFTIVITIDAHMHRPGTHYHTLTHNGPMLYVWTVSDEHGLALRNRHNVNEPAHHTEATTDQAHHKLGNGPVTFAHVRDGNTRYSVDIKNGQMSPRYNSNVNGGFDIGGHGWEWLARHNEVPFMARDFLVYGKALSDNELRDINRGVIPHNKENREERHYYQTSGGRADTDETTKAKADLAAAQQELEQAKQILSDKHGENPHTFSWQVQGDWSACSNRCEPGDEFAEGEQTLSVNCIRSDGIRAIDADCSGLEKPRSSKACNTDRCGTYRYHEGQWTECRDNNGNTKQCATGAKRSRTVQCVVAETTGDYTPIDNNDCEKLALVKPADSENCTWLPPCDTYRYVAGDWFPCTTDKYDKDMRPCGTGKTTRPVSCLDGDDQPVDEHNCTDERPESEMDCIDAGLVTRDCTTYSYYPRTDWGPCSAECGDGTQTRTVACSDSPNGPPTDDFHCAPWAEENGPFRERECEGTNCRRRSTIQPYMGTRGLSCTDVCNNQGMQCDAVSLASDALVGKPEDNQMFSKLIEDENMRIRGKTEYRGYRREDGAEVDKATGVPGLWVHSDGSATVLYKGNNELATDCKTNWDDLRRACICK